MTNDELRQLLLTGLDYSHLHDDWVCPLEEALQGVTAEQASRATSPAEKCIWEIVLHLAVWNENILERINGGEPIRPIEGAWPQMPPDHSAHQWEQAKLRLKESLVSIRNLIETAPIEKLLNAPYGPADLLCRFLHNAYHIGQLTKMN
ncbi:MAG: DinB family protein [Fimbriimonadales bacterium]